MTKTKRCAKHGELSASQIKSGVYRGKKYNKCRKCENERFKKYRDKNAEKLNEKDKAYWKENKPKITERRQAPERLAKRREWAQQNKDRYASYYAAKQKKYESELADPYIKKRIQNGNKLIRFDMIPNSLVELQRAIIKARRGIKSIQIQNKGEKIDVINQKCRATTRLRIKQSGKTRKK
jgi:hypothetical protein